MDLSVAATLAIKILDNWSLCKYSCILLRDRYILNLNNKGKKATMNWMVRNES